MMRAPLSFISPAKVNLYLHVTGKREDGYHLLDSLVAFVKGVHDCIGITAADKFSFDITGPFADKFSREDVSAENTSGNLVVRAAKAYGAATNIDPMVAITLEKNIPMGAGLGGGSGDAAATLRGLEQFYGVPVPVEKRDALLLSLGADVPVCDKGTACRFQGIGEIITPCAPLPKIPILLVWPGVPSMTKDVFAKLSPDDFTAPAAWPENLANGGQLIAFLKITENTLSKAAQESCPAIGEAVHSIAGTPGCQLARMSGSGSCVFGLYGSHEECATAAKSIKDRHSSWWVQQGTL